MAQWSFGAATFDVDISESGVPGEWVKEREREIVLPPGATNDVITTFGTHSARRSITAGQVSSAVRSTLNGYFESDSVQVLTDDQSNTQNAIIGSYAERRSDPAATRWDIEMTFIARP